MLNTIHVFITHFTTETMHHYKNLIFWGEIFRVRKTICPYQLELWVFTLEMSITI